MLSLFEQMVWHKLSEEKKENSSIDFDFILIYLHGFFMHREKGNRKGFAFWNEKEININKNYGWGDNRIMAWRRITADEVMEVSGPSQMEVSITGLIGGVEERGTLGVPLGRVPSCCGIRAGLICVVGWFSSGNSPHHRGFCGSWSSCISI